MILLNLLFAIITITIISECHQYTNNSSQSYRLPNYVIPKSYDLELTSYLNERYDEKRNFTFDGNIKIIITNKKKNNNQITLHARSLYINDDNIEIMDQNETVNYEFQKDYNKKNQFLKLTLTNQLLDKNVDYVIKIKYHGIIGHQFMNGFYWSRYNTDSDDNYVAATQFSANAARKAFPCFDEPGIKATFKLTMNHHKNYVALSNMPFVQAKSLNSNRSITIFDTTKVKISTFLVAFALINYNIIPKNDTHQTIYVPEFLQNNTKFSLDHATKSLKFMETYTNIKYKLPKLDHLAVPKFGASAMENWGLIIYRANKLIYNPEQNTIANKQDVARIIAHEISHQWFGNLVTPEWWDYIWLSEGFATYMEYFILSNTIPEWRLMDQFVVNVQQKIMLTDATNQTHALEINVDNPDYWSADLIDYHKGGSILRMISYIMGEKNFQEALKTYLKELSEGLTNTEKLWKYLQTKSSQYIDIAEVGNTWIKNIGFPIVTIVRKYTDNKYYLTQNRFLFLHENSDNKIWIIPLRIVTRSNLNFSNLSPTHWMYSKEISMSVNDVNNGVANPQDWYILNPEQTGYYRVNYDLVNWQSLIDYLMSPEYDKIPPVTRSQLIDDSLHLAESGYLTFDVALSLTKYLEMETDVIPWIAAISALQRVHINAMQSEFEWNYKIHMQTISNAMYKKLSNGFEIIDDHLINLGRTKILPHLCNVDNKECIEQSQNILMNNILSNKNHENIPMDLKGVVYCNGVRTLNETMWRKIYEEKYLANWNEFERNQVAFGLGCSSNLDILRNYLFMLLESEMAATDRTTAFEGILTNLPVGVNVALDFLEQNIADIRKTFNDVNLITIMEKIAENLVTPEQVQRFKDAIDELESRSRYQMQRAIKIADDNLEWHNNYYDILKDWFTKSVVTTDNPSSTNNSSETTSEDSETPSPDSGHSIYLQVVFLSMSIFILCLS